jgi:hypothetical protein
MKRQGESDALNPVADQQEEEQDARVGLEESSRFRLRRAGWQTVSMPIDTDA